MQYDYNYRVYGFTKISGYVLLKKTNSYYQAISYGKKKEYDKILIIRHNIYLNMDEPIKLIFPSEEKVRVRK